MTKNCPELDRLEMMLGEGTLPYREEQLFQEHARGCPECHSQWAAHLELRRFVDGVERPALSSDFEQRLRVRLRTMPNIPPQLSRRATVWLSLYWILAGMATVLILIRADWPEPIRTPWIPFALLLALCAGVLVELVPIRQLRRFAALVRLAENPDSVSHAER